MSKLRAKAFIPQIRPILWRIITSLLFILILTNKENLPRITLVKSYKKKLRQVEKKIK